MKVRRRSLLGSPLLALLVACGSSSSDAPTSTAGSGGATTSSGGTGGGSARSGSSASGGRTGAGGSSSASAVSSGAGGASSGAGGVSSTGRTGSGGASATDGGASTSISSGGGRAGGGSSTIQGSGGGGASSSGSGGTTLDGGSSDGSSIGIPSCPNRQSGGPAELPVAPTELQVGYQRTELTAFIHLGMATFDGTEQGNMSVDTPSLFNPTNLNADTVTAWVAALKSAGFKQAMLTTKHSTGFCLWPSKYTDFSVKNSPWMNGQGDVVKLWTDAMHAAGLRVGIYLAPWDQSYPSSKSDYETYFKNQLTELLSNYGPVYEVEFDGYNAPTSNVDWTSIFALAKQLQPNVLVWAGPEIVKTGATPDLEWIGNENGKAARTTSSVDTKNCGGQSGWCPYECNVSDRVPNWFWHPNTSPMPLSQMQSIYYATVGMNCTLIFNVPPTTTGEFDTADTSLLEQFGSWYASLYTDNLAKAQSVTADSTWATAGFEADKAVDDDVCTYWAAASGKTSARLEVTLSGATSAKLLSIREPVELGERTTKYHVEIKQNGTWDTAPTDASGTKIQGTVIGQRQVWQLKATGVEAVALVVESAKDVPAISELSLY